ncbi:MBL fold metallo-hydrolase [Xylanimonas ulmi]|uniref:L-ascorbate metabolism protein UlaG (Beta-lactamase superfamily) n=1 Tax=Xylanimonas ulmi TaxID=228973 RepID=A0A4Q7LZL8_9MICO|nr:MBL fold metallo-hydrolase [Xylanibacterium ulmi]RZS60885.1 L-ascorbate metabolism protein UlaG (beta-lactamase superfamily) [Xylanibacterium ulmi]
MRLTFHGHACVRLDHADTALAIDPGSFSQAASALDGASAILITHDHADHMDVDALTAALTANPSLEVYASGPAAQSLRAGGAPVGAVHAVEPGQELTLGGARIVVGGGAHALIHSKIPQAVNVTFLVELDGRVVYHPGDSFDPPGRDVDVLLTPVSGPWMKLAEAIDYAASARAPYVVPIHDVLLSEVGNRMAQRHVGDRDLAGKHEYRRLALGQSLSV